MPIIFKLNIDKIKWQENKLDILRLLNQDYALKLKQYELASWVSMNICL